MRKVFKSAFTYVLLGIAFVSIILISFPYPKHGSVSPTLTNSSDFLCRSDTASIMLSSLVKESPILIYRFDESICSPCLEANIKCLMENFTIENVFFLCSFRFDHDLYVFKKKKKNRIPNL